MRVFWRKIRTRFLISVTARLRVQTRVRLDSPLMNWTSTRDYLQGSNNIVWYIANGFVCWLSWELNLFVNMFITFARECYWFYLCCHRSVAWYHLVYLSYMIWKFQNAGVIFIFSYVYSVAYEPQDRTLITFWSKNFLSMGSNTPALCYATVHVAELSLAL